MDGRIGDELRQGRRARGIGLEEVEAATGIRARFLRAIEDEDWEALPGEFYARAFTRTYAGFLGLDPADFALGSQPDEGEEEGGPRVEPRLVPETPSARQPRRLAALAAALAALVVAAALVVLIVSLGDGGSTRSAAPADGGETTPEAGQQHDQPPPPATSLRLTATAEVWVCLLNGSGEPLIDGQILPAGDEAGPFHSRRYSMSFGNGAVELTVDGKAAPLPASSSPIGYTIGKGGKLSEIPAGERPECA